MTLSLIEAVIIVLAVVVLLQDALRLLNRSSLLYPCYVILGLALGGMLNADTTNFLKDLGSFGFIFLLFLIGLEIELPGWKETTRAIALAILWVAAHTVIIVPIGLHLGLGWESTLISMTALTACSVGMAHSAWGKYPHASNASKQRMLLWMVALEVLAVVQFSAAEPLITDGFGWKSTMRLLLVICTMIGVCLIAPKFARSLKVIIDITEGWRHHAIIFFVLVVAAFGERLGLSAPKTAFFLGLFISRSTHESLALEEHLRPIGQNLLIPIFFIALGIQVPLFSLFSMTGVWAIITCALMFVWRAILYRNFFAKQIGDSSPAFNLVGPNLSLVALAAHLMYEAHTTGPAVNWPIITGLLFTIMSIFLLPKPPKETHA